MSEDGPATDLVLAVSCRDPSRVTHGDTDECESGSGKKLAVPRVDTYLALFGTV